MSRCKNEGFAVLIRVVCMVMISLPVMVMSEEDSFRAEVRIYVDKSGMDEFKFDNPGKNLTDHVKNMFVNVNQAYKSLLPTVNLTLQLEQVIVLDKNIFKKTLAWMDHHAVYHDSAAYQFWEWAKDTYDPKAYDLTILLTGFELYNYNNHPGAFGYGYIRSVCSSNAAGAVEIQEPQGTLGLAHEIGHILGAFHDSDGEKRLCGPGSYQYGNMMNTISKMSSPLRFTFSKCSIRQISEHFANLTRDDNNCLLLPGDKNDSVPVLQTTADDLCKQKEGDGWFMYRPRGPYGDGFCRSLDCVKAENDERKFVRITPPNGLRCGKSKRCFRRKCVYVTNGDPNMSDECPWGSQVDDYVTKIYRKPCAELPCSRYGRMCCGHCTG